MGDIMIDPRLELGSLTRDALVRMAETLEDRMTFECFANLWVMVGR